MAIEEDVDASHELANGGRSYAVSQSFKLSKEEGIDDILLIGGGVIPQGDKQILEKREY